MKHNAKALTILLLAALFTNAHSVFAQSLREKLKEKLEMGGKESNLNGKKIKEMTVASDPAALVAPGGSFRVGATVILDDGKEMKTKGLNDGKVRWGNFIVKVTGGSFNDGDVNIYSDPRKVPGYKITVVIKPVTDSSIIKTIELPLTFKANYNASFNGRDGDMGKNGDKGEQGRTGSNDSKGSGGRGTDGRDGQTGGNGGRGEPGQAVDVYLTAFKDATGKTMLKVYAKSRSTDKERFFIVDPEGGSVTINARGGKGGNGGRGGDGGAGGGGGTGHQYGGSAGTDSRYGSGGDGGNGGYGADGGDGGEGGSGGTITIFVDPSAASYVGTIKYDVSGGEKGGTGFPGGGGSNGYGGNADTRGKDGTSGKGGKYGQLGREGMNGPKPQIMNQKVTINWDTVGG